MKKYKKKSRDEIIQGIVSRMKPESIAKHYLDNKDLADEQREEINSLQSKIFELNQVISEKDREIERLNNKCEYAGLKKTKLEITAVDMRCVNEDGCCEDCQGRYMSLMHFSSVVYDYSISTDGEMDDEWICGNTAILYKGATITAIDKEFNKIEYNNVYEVIKDGQQIYRAKKEAFEEFED